MLEDRGLTDNKSGDGEHPHWTVETRFYWNQKFPAGKTVVFEQSYQPVTGQAFFMSEELAPPARGDFSYGANYCFDPGTRAEIQKQLAISKAANRQDGAMLYALTTNYILMTGNNWKGPIGRFHLTLDKEKPDNVLSLCWDGDLKKTGATTFEATRETSRLSTISICWFWSSVRRINGRPVCRTLCARRAIPSCRPLARSRPALHRRRSDC